MTYDYEVWKREDLTRCFVNNVRGAIPLADEQMSVMMRLVEAAVPAVGSFLDIGCGDGLLGNLVLERFDTSNGVFVDLSPSMLRAAEDRLDGFKDRASIVQADLNSSSWREVPKRQAPFDVVVSGHAIHHLEDDRKRMLYEEIYGLLRPGGLFINIEHVATRTQWVASVADDYFIDSLHAFHLAGGSTMSREEVAKSYYHRPDAAANRCALAETQCDWLREAGYIDVDIYFKIFQLAIFGGRRALEG